MILSPAGEVAAVVDWELCTLGDPLADVGLLLVYWSEPATSSSRSSSRPTTAPGFPTATRSRPATQSARAATSREIDFYVALGLWKLAIILEGVYARYTAGQYGEPDDGLPAVRQARRAARRGRRRGRAEPAGRRARGGASRPGGARSAPLVASGSFAQRFSSRSAITILWTSSGPSAISQHAA